MKPVDRNRDINTDRQVLIEQEDDESIKESTDSDYMKDLDIILEETLNDNKEAEKVMTQRNLDSKMTVSLSN